MIGGTHLGFLDEEQLQRTIEFLKEMDIKFIGFSHCTGVGAAQKFSHQFKGKCEYASVGRVFQIL